MGHGGLKILAEWLRKASVMSPRNLFEAIPGCIRLHNRWRQVALSAVGPLALVALVALEAPAVVVAQDSTDQTCPEERVQLTKLTVDRVEILVEEALMPPVKLLPSSGRSSMQVAGGTSLDPLCGFQVFAAPYGLVFPTEGLSEARPGGVTGLTTELERQRRDAGGVVETGPAAQIFGERTLSILTTTETQDAFGNSIGVRHVEWIAEAGQRIWLIRYSRELVSGDLLAGPRLSAALANLSLRAPAGFPETQVRHSNPKSVPSDRELGSVSLLASGDLPAPPWWNGDVCDLTYFRSQAGVDSAPLGPSWRGLTPCGPVNHAVVRQFFPGAWGELEWQCVELVMRYMYLEHGIPPYSAHGKDVVPNYAGTLLEKVSNGTPGRPPISGDVLSYGPNTLNGHTAVVKSSSIDASGNGTIDIIEQNIGEDDGHRTQSVVNWSVQDANGVVGWLTLPAAASGHDDVATLYDYGTETAATHVWKSLEAGDATSLTYQCADCWWKVGPNAFDANAVAGRIAAGDFDRDGQIDDIAGLYDYGSNQAAIMTWQGGATSFSYEWRAWPLTGGYTLSQINDRFVAGDFDSDGYLDDLAALYDYGSKAQMHVWLNDGTGKFTIQSAANHWWESGGYPVSNVGNRFVSGDFDSDGFHDDIAVLYDYTGKAAMHVWRAGRWTTGSSKVSFKYEGTATSKWWYVSSGYDPMKAGARLVSGDFDDDGKHDDIVAMYDIGTGQTRLHLWTSSGSKFTYYWTAWSTSGPNQYTATNVGGRLAAGDLGGSNHDDVVAMYDYGGGEARIHLWSGAGTTFSYRGQAWWSGEPPSYNPVRVGDRFVALQLD